MSDWFDDFDYDRKTNTIPCLKQEDWDNIETKAYPIKQDGTLDIKNVIIEGIKYG